MTGALQRRLSAVLALDIVGYSRLMQLDEEGTHRRSRAFLNGTVYACVTARGGRVVKSTGDGALVEFASVVEATRCALEIHGSLPAHNENQPQDRQLNVRIGINIGDVIIESDDIFGDGVNIAARLEALARPGTICVSEPVISQISDKFPFKFEDLGFQQLKNIRNPVRAFIILTGNTGIEDAQNVAIASKPVPGFSGRPAIAVLPFESTGRDPDDEAICDGIADEVTEQLSSWRAFPVIARHSTFQFRKTQADLKAIGRELGARYLVQGSLRRIGARMRLTARLIDVETGHEVVSHRADANADDLFEVQSEIAELVVGALEPELLRVERDRVARVTTHVPSSYEDFMRGLWHHYQYTPEHNVQAVHWFRSAIAADPSNAQPHAALALAIHLAVQSDWRKDSEFSFEAGYELARRAVELDSRDPLAHFALGAGCMWLGRIAEAETEMEEAIALNPSYAAAYALNTFMKCYRGRFELALASGMKALRLSPHDPRLSLWLPGIAAAHFHLENHDEAIAYGQKALARRPGYGVPLRYVVAAMGWLGRASDAGLLVEQLRRIYRDAAGLEIVLRRFYTHEPAIIQILDGVRRAGLQ